jgi:hypothetical protein
LELKISVQTKGKIFKPEAAQIMRQALVNVMYEAVLFLEGQIRELTPIGVSGVKGGLRSTIQHEVIGKGTPIVKGTVFTQSPYGEVIEKGRRAGKTWPPEGALLRWIEVKMHAPEEQAKRLEFVIRRKIGRKGFPGVHMFEKAITRGWPKLRKMFDDAGFRIAKHLSE